MIVVASVAARTGTRCFNSLTNEKPGDINDEGINTPEPFDPNATPPELTEGNPEPIDDDGINKPRPNVKPIRKETRGRKRKKDIE